MAANPVMSPNVRYVPDLYRDKFASFTGVQTNGVATAVPPRGLTYYDFNLEFTKAAGAIATEAEIEAQITEIRIVVDGEIFWRGTPAEFHDIVQTYYGSSRGADVINGYLLLDLCERLTHVDPTHWREMAWGTGNIGQLVIEVQCGTLTNITGINLHATYDKQLRNLGIHKKILPFNFNVPAAGDFEISTLPKNPNNKIRAAHITHGAGAISKVSAIVDNENFYKETPALQIQRDVEMAGRTAISGYTHLDFNLSNEKLAGLDLTRGGRPVGDLRITPTYTGTPGNVKVILETIEPF